MAFGELGFSSLPDYAIARILAIPRKPERLLVPEWENIITLIVIACIRVYFLGKSSYLSVFSMAN